mmetsp:Transcript_25225/g.39030  ORF Transcript_25225/g.39030 Transcript_25225/m.39030 type:complete len:698 (+) Transcript_25225:1608-3701(+)
MNEVNSIVKKLNEDPFNLNLRLVDFDGKSELEVLQILNNVLSSIDPELEADIRSEEPDERAYRISEFLLILKCNSIPENDESSYRAWFEALGRGDKEVVLPALSFVLGSYEKLCKRAYLARYLIPIEPPEVINAQGDANLSDLVQKYQQLQQTFKIVHKEFEKSKAANWLSGRDLRAEIAKLEDEQQQLKDRIKTFRESFNESDFELFVSAVGKMRRAEDEDFRNEERLNEQRQELHLVEQSLRDAQHRKRLMHELVLSDQRSIEDVLAQIRSETEALKESIQRDLAPEKDNLEEELLKLDRKNNEPVRTLDDVRRLKDSSLEMENKIRELEDELRSSGQTNGMGGKLEMYWQHVNMALSKLSAKEEEFRANSDELQGIQAGITSLREKLRASTSLENDTVDRDGNPLPEENVKRMNLERAEKLKKYKQATSRLAELQAESVVLQRTEQTLRGRIDNLEEFMKLQEERAGVAGFRDAQQTLEATSEQTAEIDEVKGQTLEEISAIIKSITMKVEEKKDKLKPKIIALKETRRSFQELEHQYNEKKSRFDNVTKEINAEINGLKIERKELEENWLTEESQYYEIVALKEVALIRLNEVKQEELWQAGEGELSPDFQCLADLYKSKLVKQENYAKQLRKKQKELKENENDDLQQRAMFSDLYHLLDVKAKTLSVSSIEQKSLGAKDGVQMFGNAQILTI